MLERGVGVPRAQASIGRGRSCGVYVAREAGVPVPPALARSYLELVLRARYPLRGSTDQLTCDQSWVTVIIRVT